MNNEEIIDSVDVSGCKYINCCCYENGKCLWTKRYYENNIVPDCEKVKDCYYKRMKRLEFENKLLKADYEASEAENAKLKEENFKLDFKLGQIDIKKVTLVENRQLAEENEKLKEALENVRKYLELTGILFGDELLLDTNTQRAVDVINEVLKDE